jgi:hypothetical protein
MAANKRILSLAAALAGLGAAIPARAELRATTTVNDRNVADKQSVAGLIEDNDFVLLPGTDPDGSIYLGHESHSSHSSHSSHRSHHSSR